MKDRGEEEEGEEEEGEEKEEGKKAKRGAPGGSGPLFCDPAPEACQNHLLYTPLVRAVASPAQVQEEAHRPRLLWEEPQPVVKRTCTVV